ncbi:specifically androgen-regulated gene protein isoform X1 [Simochromis diagramma]|uniref:specifically androgen-regulated gene protein isoform X1 n=1 Tax=Simochromis diagramma TaxID=43689 RepID=UPI001A7E5EE2|nr:specifically androgen-regulated gene protein isoform X1 [Simochromis diagramma]XP_039861831.1 specifically androgen-regulated gene protein isoform X1 [Simochromis diagramma]
MPISDTWPGDTGMETMNGMESAGSCDSVVSVNSGFSDDSLEHLSAEERACLMFLEETIESLDTEEDSGVSNDEPEQLPSSCNLATKVANLSASMSKSNLDDSQTSTNHQKPINKNFDARPMHSYLVPTPLLVASSTTCSVLGTKPGTPAVKTASSKPQFTSKNNKPGYKDNQKAVVHPTSSEANVIPPSTKPSVRTAEGPLPRGPLSYDALVHLRRSASTKKTPLCPTVDHTIDSEKCHSAPVEGPTLGNLQRSEKSQSEVSKYKKGPPVVPPKPKKFPTNISAKTQNEESIISDSSYSVKNVADPQVVRVEALQKLGLLKGQEAENDKVTPLPTPKPNSSLGVTADKFTRGPANSNPSRSQSFCNAQVPKESNNRPLQTSANLRQYTKHDQRPGSASHPAQSKGKRTANLEQSATLDNCRSSGNTSEPQSIKSAKPVTTTRTTTTAPPVPQKTSNSVGYTVMVVPGMGGDRKEALKKLGLLKD